MYITNKQFVEKALDVGLSADEFLDILEVTATLLKRHGNRLKLDHIQQAISDVSPEVADFVALLEKYDKLSDQDLLDMQRIAEKHAPEREKRFQISSPAKHDKIAAHLKESFDDVAISAKTTDSLEVKVAGEGLYYKRGLVRDLDTLLQ